MLRWSSSGIANDHLCATFEILHPQRLSGSFALPLNDLTVQSRPIANVSPPVTYGLLVLGWVLLLGFALSVAALGGVAPDVRTFQVAYMVGFVGYGLLIGVLARSRECTKIGRWPW